MTPISYKEAMQLHGELIKLIKDLGGVANATEGAVFDQIPNIKVYFPNDPAGVFENPDGEHELDKISGSTMTFQDLNTIIERRIADNPEQQLPDKHKTQLNMLTGNIERGLASLRQKAAAADGEEKSAFEKFELYTQAGLRIAEYDGALDYSYQEALYDANQSREKG